MLRTIMSSTNEEESLEDLVYQVKSPSTEIVHCCIVRALKIIGTSRIGVIFLGNTANATGETLVLNCEISFAGNMHIFLGVYH